MSEKVQIASYEIAEVIAVKLKLHNLTEQIILPGCRKIIKMTTRRTVKSMSQNIKRTTEYTLINFSLQID